MKGTPHHCSISRWIVHIADLPRHESHATTHKRPLNYSTGGPHMSILFDALTLVAFPIDLVTLAWIRIPPVDSLWGSWPGAASRRELPAAAAARARSRSEVLEAAGAAEELLGAAEPHRVAGSSWELTGLDSNSSCRPTVGFPVEAWSINASCGTTLGAGNADRQKVSQ